MFTEKLPYIENIKEIWVINFYPSWVFFLFKHLFGGFYISLINYLVYFGDFVKDKSWFDVA